MHQRHHGASERSEEPSESDSTLTLVLDLTPRPRPAGLLEGVVGLGSDFRA